MSPPVNQRVAPNRVVLILVLLLVVWLGFEFYPRKKPVPTLAPVTAVPESKLHAMGLTDNPDWDGLPEIFAVWADKAEWKDGQTRFAYWHPVMKTYSYYFEATRDGAGFRFKEIAEPRDSDYDWDESLGQDCPIRFYRSESFTLPAKGMSRPIINRGDPGRLPEKAVRPPDQIKVPPVELKLTPPDIERKH